MQLLAILAFALTMAPCITIVPAPIVALGEMYALGEIIVGNLNPISTALS